MRRTATPSRHHVRGCLRILGVGCLSVLLWLASGSGCTPYQVYKLYTTKSSRQIKNELQDLFLIRSAHIFYPYGAPKDPTDLPDLDDKQIGEIQRFFETVVGSLEKVHARQVHVISRFFERQIPKDFHVRIKITNVRGPIARMEPRGRLLIDVKVVQALYRTAVIKAMGDHKSESEALKEFFEFIEKIDKLEGHRAFGDMFETVKVLKDESESVDGSGLLQSYKLTAESNVLLSDYLSSIRFMIGHEIGHQVLGHFGPRYLASMSCASFQELELEADAYAVILARESAEHFKDLSSMQAAFQDTFKGMFEVDSKVAWRLDLEAMKDGALYFFSYAYDFSGFGNVKPEGCSHPEPGDRKARIEHLYNSISDEQSEVTWRQVLSNYQSRTDK